MASIGFGQEAAGDGRRRSRARLVAVAGLAVLVLAGAAVAAVDTGTFSFAGNDASLSVFDGASHEAASTSGAGGNLAAGRTGAMALDDASGAARSAAPPSPAPPLQTEPPGVPGSEPRIVKHADLAIEVDGSLFEAFERVTEVAHGHNGFVVSSSTSSVDEGSARAELTLRVPAERFDDARAALAQVGEVRSLQVDGDDVTAQLVDLDARLRALRAEEDALNGLLGQAGNVGEVLAVREQVSATRLEIEQLAAQQASLEDRATFSTLRVTLSPPGGTAFSSEPEPEPGLARSFERALAGAVAVVGGMVVVLGYVAPFLVLGLLVWSGLWLARLRRRPA